MLNELYQAKIAKIFQKAVPHLDFSTLESKSIRNQLLAHFLIEDLTETQIREAVKRDSRQDCIPKLVILDETNYVTDRYMLFINWKRDEKPDHMFGKNYDRRGYGTVFCGSSLDKVVMISALRIHNTLNQTKEYCVPYAEQREADISHLLDSDAFRNLSEGADPAHAAGCYMNVLEKGTSPQDIPVYEARLDTITSSPELRQLIAFKGFHDRTVREEQRQANISALQSDMNMGYVFLQSVKNWHLDYLHRLDTI